MALFSLLYCRSFRGLLVGAYLGWGLSPQHLSAMSAPDKAASGSLTEVEAGAEEEDDVIDVMHVSHTQPLKRRAGPSFCSGLACSWLCCRFYARVVGGWEGKSAVGWKI